MNKARHEKKRLKCYTRAVFHFPSQLRFSLSQGEVTNCQKKMADALKVQLNIRQNAEELQDLLKDLDSWQDEMKAKDEELRHAKIITKQVCFHSRY